MIDKVLDWEMSVNATSTKTVDTEDPVERMLKKTGCIDLHYQLQECFFETQDWRKCQDQVQKFKECMLVYQKKQEEKYKNL